MPGQGAGLAISRAAADLVLTLLDLPVPVVSGAVMETHFGHSGQELIARGLLLPYDCEEVVVAEDDTPMSLLPSPGTADLGFFSPARGWVSVPPTRLHRFRVDVEAVIGLATAKLERLAPASAPTSIRLSPHLWDLGFARVLQRGPATSVWFARRLASPAVRDEVAYVARRRPPPGLPLLLTSTAAEAIGALSLPGHQAISIRDVAFHDARLTVDPAILAARASGRPEMPVSEPLYLSPDGRTLVIHGSEEMRFKSSVHIAIVRRLVADHKARRRSKATELLDEANSNAGSLQRAFGREKWRALSRYLRSVNGQWGFEL